MKSLMGYTSMSNNLCEGNIEALSKRLNEFLVSVSNNLPRLTDDLAVFDVQDEIVLDMLGSSDHRMVLFKPSCDAMLDTGNMQRAVVRRFTANKKSSFRISTFSYYLGTYVCNGYL